VLKIIGHPITINATDVDQGIGLGSWSYSLSFLGWTEPGTTRTYNLVVNGNRKYDLWAYLTNQFATFEVQPTGVITYDNSQIGIIEGNETSVLKIIGHPITINATGVDQQIGLGQWNYPLSFLGWTEPGTTRTYNLVVNGNRKYDLWAYYTNKFATFEVQPTGVITYDNSHIGIIEGNETNTVKPIGHPITIDAINFNQRVAIGAWIYPESFLGWIEPGTTRTINLIVNGNRKYDLWTNISGIMQAEFTVFRNGSCGPNEFHTDYGIILITYDDDDDPPVTDIILSGTTGNNGWFTSDVHVTLTATDEGTGVERTEYSFDGVNWIYYSGTFLVNPEAITTIFYRSIDEAGNIEIMKDIDIKIDKTQPDTQLAMNMYYIDPLGDIYVTSSTEFSLTGSDTTSGVESIYYRINGGVWYEYFNIFTLNSNGLYTIEYYSVDIAGNEELFNSVTVYLSDFEVTSYLSKGEDTPIDYFDVIFTKSKQTGEYKLVATNPGQMFYIIELVNNWPTSIESLDFEVILPEDFLMKGSEPIHIYLDGVDITTDCVINGNFITVMNILPGAALEIIVHIDYGLKGTYYANLDDFGMIGYSIETLVSGLNGVNGFEQSSQASATLIAHQKKTTAIAGYVYNTNGDFLEGLTVELYQNGVLIGTTTTDENGFYYFIDIDEGDYEVHVLFNDSNEIQVATASKNELEEVNFELLYDPL